MKQIIITILIALLPVIGYGQRLPEYRFTPEKVKKKSKGMWVIINDGDTLLWNENPYYQEEPVCKEVKVNDIDTLFKRRLIKILKEYQEYCEATQHQIGWIYYYQVWSGNSLDTIALYKRYDEHKDFALMESNFIQEEPYMKFKYDPNSLTDFINWLEKEEK